MLFLGFVGVVVCSLWCVGVFGGIRVLYGVWGLCGVFFCGVGMVIYIGVWL